MKTSIETSIEGLLAEGKVLRISPRGYSMYPLFVPGRDEALIAPIETKELRRGNVVLYRREQGILVLHRIFKRDREGIYLVGDNQKEIEGPLPPEQMKGILIGVIRKGRQFSTRHPIYRIFSEIWLLCRPFRPMISHCLAAVKRVWPKNK